MPHLLVVCEDFQLFLWDENEIKNLLLPAMFRNKQKKNKNTSLKK